MDQRDGPVALAVEDGRATLRLNRPEVLNALDRTLAEAFLDAVRSIKARDDIRVIVLRGEGRAFCAGGDVSRFTSNEGGVERAIRAIMDPMHEAVLVLESIPAPSIAQVHGVAAGGGFSLMLACDLAVASDDARFSSAYARLGTSPDVSLTFRLPRVVGMRKAKELALLSDTFDAKTALELGLVNRIVPAADLDAAVDDWARRLAAGPTAAYAATRRLLARSDGAELRDQLEAEQKEFLAATRTADFAEGVAAFLSKRAPRFEGR